MNFAHRSHGVLAAVATAALIASGCANQRTVKLYDGPMRDRDAVAVLVLPYELDAVSVDDRDIPTQWGNPDSRAFQLAPGRHRITLRYSRAWPNTELDNGMVKSSPVTVEFDARAGGAYHAEPPMPRSFREATQFIGDMGLRIAGDDGVQAVVQPLDQLKHWWEQASADERTRFRDYIGPR